MSVMPGTRLGPHEISAKLGAGGMGEVYRATDAKLGREVAIKVLPAEVPGDTERLARCEREAKLLAALDHPAIAHVYGFESATPPAGALPGPTRGVGFGLVGRTIAVAGAGTHGPASQCWADPGVRRA